MNIDNINVTKTTESIQPVFKLTIEYGDAINLF